ncbi:hypothetical protein D1816_12025 [Aquimarina sp. AD10]|uniref:hypothetical protein n=1 Tax=Aquimarina sp. AD10 TaxID=1714849 RepID=UPI000E53E514|nr:hypothetical protein [Aquimarina sp. AD10]AXT61044.1 hypothetical protein D1816_12025 [Aquimarina sp. AD10]RKM96342.1 hypothetical protein D7033_15760 [Aquimarina sp. AD10]
MKLKYLVFVCLLFSVFHTVNAQWVKGKKKGYYKLSAWSLVADQHYTDTGNIDPNATRGLFNLSFYGEYGITNKLDIIAYVPFFSRTYQNDQVSGTTGEVILEGEDLNSIGDSDIGLRYSIVQHNKLALSASLKLGLPIGEDTGGSDGSFQTGDGEFNQLLQLDLGIPIILKEIPLYIKTFLGFNNRTQNFSDELHFGGEVGISFWKNKIWLIGRLSTVQSLQNGDRSAQSSQGSIFANNIEYTSLGGEIAYYITKKIGLSFSYTSTIDGRIVYANPALSGGIFIDIK